MARTFGAKDGFPCARDAAEYTSGIFVVNAGARILYQKNQLFMEMA